MTAEREVPMGSLGTREAQSQNVGSLGEASTSDASKDDGEKLKKGKKTHRKSIGMKDTLIWG